MTDLPEPTAGIHLAKVVSVDDPQGRGRAQVLLAGLGLTLWAPVLVPSAGPGYGVALTPRPGEVVAVAFAGGDLASPIVLGALWSGADTRPPAAGSPDRTYAVVSPAGAVLRLDDAAPAIAIETDSSRLRVSGGPGGAISIESDGASIRLDAAGITVTSSGKVSVTASTIAISAGMVTLDAGMTRAAGVVQCDTLIANSVVAASYTPGAGNVF